MNWTLGNKLQWNLNRNSCIFIQENAFENVVWKMAAIDLNVLTRFKFHTGWQRNGRRQDQRESKHWTFDTFPSDIIKWWFMISKYFFYDSLSFNRQQAIIEIHNDAAHCCVFGLKRPSRVYSFRIRDSYMWSSLMINQYWLIERMNLGSVWLRFIFSSVYP